MKRTKPYDKKNHAPICKLYFLGNKCRKGDECPYRHQGPVMGDPKEAINIQRARNIYKLMKSQSKYRHYYKMRLLELLDDESNRTLCVGDVRFNQQDLRDVELRDVILAHGEIETIEMKRTKPYDKKNHAPICKLYFLGNKCRKGDECPYRHEGPVMGDPKEAINMDWPYKMRPLEPLDDKSIRTLCVGDVRFNQQDLRDVILAHGEIETIEMGPSSGCVVVTYTTRERAVKAMKEFLNTLVNGMRPRVMWLRMPQVDEYCRYEPTPVKPPNDKSIRILYVREPFGGIDEQDLKDVISAHGEIESIEMDPSKDCAVVAYTTREGAEMAAKELSDKVVNGTRLMVSWYIPQPQPQPQPQPDLIQPQPYPTSQFSNLKIEPNMLIELSAAHPPCSIPQPKP